MFKTNNCSYFSVWVNVNVNEGSPSKLEDHIFKSRSVTAQHIFPYYPLCNAINLVK